MRAALPGSCSSEVTSRSPAMLLPCALLCSADWTFTAVASAPGPLLLRPCAMSTTSSPLLLLLLSQILWSCSTATWSFAHMLHPACLVPTTLTSWSSSSTRCVDTHSSSSVIDEDRGVGEGQGSQLLLLLLLCATARQTCKKAVQQLATLH